MAGPLRPEDVTSKSFKSGWRGYDAGAVDAFLREAAAALTSFQEENEQLRDRLRRLGDRDLHAEFDQVSAEIGELLQGARETAEGMRLRASLDAEQIVGEARDDAVKVRQDAWNEGTSLLEDSHQEASAVIEKAKRDSLAIISDAERDAHRNATKGRKDAEETIRRAKLQADQLVVGARTRHDELIRDGEAEVAAAQERVAVLMQRRDELLAEIESVQSKINELRAELEERRAEIGKARAVDTSSVKVLPGPVPDEKEKTSRPTEAWRQGEEMVRIVRPPRRTKTPSADIDADSMAAEVRRLRKPPEPDLPAISESAEPTPDVSVEPKPTVEPGEAKPTPVVPSGPELIETQPATAQEAVEVLLNIDDLFARLRSQPEAELSAAPLEAPTVSQIPSVQSEPKTSPIPLTDPFELRDRLLLPITNKTLRTLKRNLTEAQNIALDELRIQETAWEPDVAALEARVFDDLMELVRRGSSAGWSGAERLLDRELEETETEVESPAAHDFAVTVSRGVRSALASAGEGPRQRAAAISRVYRAWRVDEAERRVRSIGIGAYHDGLIRAFLQAGVPGVRWIVSGRGCVTCRAMVEAGPVEPGAMFASDTSRPPAHESCGCVLVPV